MLLYNPDTFPQQETASGADWVWQPVTMVGSVQVQGCCGWSRVNRSACVLLLLLQLHRLYRLLCWREGCQNAAVAVPLLCDCSVL